MKPALAQPRSSELVEEELRSLEETVAGVPPPPPGDFAAELQWRAWNNHRAELEEELSAARALEQRADAEHKHALASGLTHLIDKILHLFRAKEHDSASKGEAVLPGGDKDREPHA